MRLFKQIVVLGILLIIGAIGFAYSGLINVSAIGKDPALVSWFLETTREHSVERRAKEVTAPDIQDKQRQARGGRAFSEMCAGCHGAPGRDPFIGARDMNPPPPKLTEAAEEDSPEQIFWIVKHGIRMTGMPAWGLTHSDEQLWDLVAFIKQLPALTPESYRTLVSSVHDDGHEHGHMHGSQEEGVDAGQIHRDTEANHVH